MKHLYKFFISIVAAVIIFSSTVPAYAQYGLPATVKKTPYSTSIDFFGIIGKIVSGALGTLAIIFFAMAFYAGVRWMTARGDDSYVEKAKDTLRAAVIGLVITLSSYALTSFVFERLSNTTQTATPAATPTAP